MSNVPPTLRRQRAYDPSAADSSDDEREQFSDSSSIDGDLYEGSQDQGYAFGGESKESQTFQGPTRAEQLLQLRRAFDAILGAIRQDKTVEEAYAKILNIRGDTELAQMLPSNSLDLIQELKLHVSILEKIRDKINILESGTTTPPGYDSDSNVDSETDIYEDMNSDDLAEMPTDEDSDSEDTPTVARQLRF